LPESIKKSNCREVYIYRNPFNVVASWFHFSNVEGEPEKLDEEYFLVVLQERSCGNSIKLGLVGSVCLLEA
jgi:hypothetical protein